MESTLSLRKLYRIYAIAVFSGLVAGPALADPIGLWRGSDGSVTRVVACGSAMCGFVASVNPNSDPTTGRPWTDKNNADASKRGRPLVGVQVLISMMPNGPGKWSGRLYNADDGRTYSGNLLQVDAQTIRVEGCVVGICGGESLIRLR